MSDPQHFEAGDAGHGIEVVVLGDDGQLVRECGGGDPQVVDVEPASRLGEVDAQARTITCEWHGAAFCLLTGEPTCPPATRPIAIYRAKIEDGAVWVVWPKGRKEFREDDVRAYGPRAKLVDVKVVRFSDALSALKMMIPRAQR